MKAAFFYLLYIEKLSCNSRFFISFSSFRRRITDKIAVNIFTPTKLNQIPSKPKLHNAPRIITGKTNAVPTEITVAWKGFLIALNKLCVTTPNQRNRYAKQNNLIA